MKQSNFTHLTCCFKSQAPAYDLVQYEQRYRLSPRWRLMCSSNLVLLTNPRLHIWHWNGRSPARVFDWVVCGQSRFKVSQVPSPPLLSVCYEITYTILNNKASHSSAHFSFIRVTIQDNLVYWSLTEMEYTNFFSFVATRDTCFFPLQKE